VLLTSANAMHSQDITRSLWPWVLGVPGRPLGTIRWSRDVREPRNNDRASIVDAIKFCNVAIALGVTTFLVLGGTLEAADGDAKVQILLEGLSSARDVHAIPLANIPSGQDAQLAFLLHEKIPPNAGEKMPAEIATRLRRLTSRALTELPSPRPFPFHLDAAIRFDDLGRPVVLIVCRICQYGYLYRLSDNGLVSSRRIAIKDMEAVLESASADYRNAPHAQ